MKVMMVVRQQTREIGWDLDQGILNDKRKEGNTKEHQRESHGFARSE